MANRKTPLGLPIWLLAAGCIGTVVVVGLAVLVVLAISGVILFDRAAETAAEPGAQTPVAAVTVAVATTAPTPTAGPTATVSPTATTDARAATEADPTVVPAVTSPAETDPLPYAETLAAVEANVVAIRGLEPRRPVELMVLDKAELRLRLERDLAEDYGPEEARDDAIALSQFDFVEPTFDLYAFTLDLLTEQVAGFYDPEDDEFVVISEDETFDAAEQWTHAHEYVHALQDQYYDLALLEDESDDSEAGFALRALAEGDATLVQTLYLMEGYFSEAEIGALFTELGDVEMEILASAPPIFIEELTFPYTAGLTFVQTLFARGGFAAVDAAWQEPPLSSEQIIHPQRYLDGDAPQLVTLAPLTDTLGSGWRQVDEDILGEFFLREYLEQQLPEETAAEAAAGWGGDRFAVYWNEASGETVLALALVWDTEADAAEFQAAYPAYPAGLLDDEAETVEGGQCWSAAETICLFAEQQASLVVRAPDVGTALLVAATLRE